MQALSPFYQSMDCNFAQHVPAETMEERSFFTVVEHDIQDLNLRTMMRHREINE